MNLHWEGVISGEGYVTGTNHIFHVRHILMGKIRIGEIWEVDGWWRGREVEADRHKALSLRVLRFDGEYTNRGDWGSRCMVEGSGGGGGQAQGAVPTRFAF